MVINKTDAVKKESILQKIAEYSELYPFKEIFPVSALKKDGIETLITSILDSLSEGPQYFPADITADTTMRTIVAEIIREKILLNTNDEIPHGTGVEIIQYKEPKKADGITTIEANIYCEKASHKGIIIGKNGEKLKRIGSLARRDIERISGGNLNEFNTLVNRQFNEAGATRKASERLYDQGQKLNFIANQHRK